MSANVEFVIETNGVKFHFGRRISTKNFTTDFGKNWEANLVSADLGQQLTQLVRLFGNTMAATVYTLEITPRDIILRTWDGFDLSIAQNHIRSTIGAAKFVEERKSRIARIGR